MALVSYSDSEGSGDDEVPKESTTNGAHPKASKPAFRKVVDRSHPHKIRVNLSQSKSTEQTNERSDDEPPAKKARTAAGTFSGFNSILPAPKRAIPATGGLTNGGSRKGSLGSGVSLKTGAAPGFSREPLPDRDIDPEPEGTNTEVGDEDPHIKSVDLSMSNNPAEMPNSITSAKDSKEEPKKKGNAMMFKPLSIARKPQKKKAIMATASTAKPLLSSDPEPQIKSNSKTTLFSMENLDEVPTTNPAEAGEYQPLIYENPYTKTTEPLLDIPLDADPEDTDIPKNPTNFQPTSNTKTRNHDLDTIAADLNLSASARRQLLGRQRNNHNNASNINLVDFNTDQEYAANELLRQAGEQAQHNPVRALAAGKHSLKQLINAASNQKDALEEQFASGRRNKREAGSKYGW